MKIAIIGSGISGLTAAYLLHRQHDITVYEAEDYIGGHTHTVTAEIAGRAYWVDIGFIVCNDRTYPGFFKLLDQLDVKKTATQMGFGIRSDRTGIEYSTTGLNRLFAQRKNLLNVRFLGMLTNILRFNRELTKALREGSLDPEMTLGQYLQEQKYGPYFIDHFIVPMGAAIWSIGLRQMMAFPLLAFARFFDHHGLLTVGNQPQWYFIENGSHSYVKKMTAGFIDRIRLSTPVSAVTRSENEVRVTTGDGTAVYDQVVFAAHSDQTLKMLADPTPKEQDILSAIGYQSNAVILHHDTGLLPVNRRVWAAWNYHLHQDKDQLATLTYNMNLLQQISAPETICVTLNDAEQIDPARTLAHYRKDHPVFDRPAIEAQQRYGEIGGHHRTHFCGAYWFNGFHEDGVQSALRVANAFGEEL